MSYKCIHNCIINNNNWGQINLKQVTLTFWASYLTIEILISIYNIADISKERTLFYDKFSSQQQWMYLYIKIYFIEIQVVQGTETCFAQRNDKTTK